LADGLYFSISGEEQKLTSSAMFVTVKPIYKKISNSKKLGAKLLENPGPHSGEKVLKFLTYSTILVLKMSEKYKF